MRNLQFYVSGKRPMAWVLGHDWFEDIITGDTLWYFWRKKVWCTIGHPCNETLADCVKVGLPCGSMLSACFWWFIMNCTSAIFDSQIWHADIVVHTCSVWSQWVLNYGMESQLVPDHSIGIHWFCFILVIGNKVYWKIDPVLKLYLESMKNHLQFFLSFLNTEMA